MNRGQRTNVCHKHALSSLSAPNTKGAIHNLQLV